MIQCRGLPRKLPGGEGEGGDKSWLEDNSSKQPVKNTEEEPSGDWTGGAPVDTQSLTSPPPEEMVRDEDEVLPQNKPPSGPFAPLGPPPQVEPEDTPMVDRDSVSPEAPKGSSKT